MHDAVATEPGRRGHPPGHDRRQRGLVDLHDEPVDARQPAAYVVDVGEHALGQPLGQVAAGAGVAEHPVAARLLDGGGQGPRAGHLDLERAGVVLGLLLEPVEVLGEQAARAAVVDPGRRSGCR